MLNPEPPVPADGLCDPVTGVVKDGVGLGDFGFELRDRADLRHSRLMQAGSPATVVPASTDVWRRR